MSETTEAVYLMNPAEDEIRYGHELADGMLVLAEDPGLRQSHGKDEEGKLRRQRFRKVTRLDRTFSANYVRFIGEWIDGYQEVHTASRLSSWLVKKDAEATP